MILTGKHRLLITGASSCTASHAFDLCYRCEGLFTLGSVREEVGSSMAFAATSRDCISIDFGDSKQIQDQIDFAQPDVVIHLAGCSDAGKPDEMLHTNICGTWNLLSACQKLQKPVDVLLVGSAASFGAMQPDEVSLGSLRRPAPASLYGQTRQTALEIGKLLDGTADLRVFLCRTFNLIGPGLSDRYVPTALLDRIRNAHQRGATHILIRDLNTVRDFIDVRDAVAAYFKILDRGRSGHPYSVGRGQGVSIRELAEEIVDALNIKMEIIGEESLTTNPRSGISRSISDPSDLVADTGWQARFTLRASILDMLAQHQTSPINNSLRQSL